MNRIRINILLLLLCIFIPGVAQNVSDGWNKNRTARLTKPVFVYNNWSAYDELSDNIPLDEALAMKELDHIVRLKKLGVQVDYYMMDAFWFDVNEGYRKWRPDCWPEGPKRWLDACKRDKARIVVFYEPAAHRWRGKYDEDYSGMGKLCGRRRNNSLSVQGRIFAPSYADPANVRGYGY